VSPSEGGSGACLLNNLISFLSMLISLAHSRQGNNPCQHLDEQQHRTTAEDTREPIQLGAVEPDAAAHVQRLPK
jgi:hypothetical protein